MRVRKHCIFGYNPLMMQYFWNPAARLRAPDLGLRVADAGEAVLARPSLVVKHLGKEARVAANTAPQL